MCCSVGDVALKQPSEIPKIIQNNEILHFLFLLAFPWHHEMHNKNVMLVFKHYGSYRLEILDIETRGIILSKQRTTKVRMRRLICAFVVRIWLKQVFS